MKYIKGFFMAWGMFCRIPCPYKVWEEDIRIYMLKMLPLIGLMMGIIVSICWWLLDMAGLPAILVGVIVTAVYFWMTGYIHMDGFMDCCDAILSRRPEMEERQRILKASDVGAFAVISVIFTILIFAASFIALCETGFAPEAFATIPLLFMVSRAVAACDVISKKPMVSSQYQELCRKKVQGTAILVIIILPTVVVCGVVIYLMQGSSIIMMIFAIMIAAEKLVGAKARKELGGMNGDISGYMITLGEALGILLIAIAMCTII